VVNKLIDFAKKRAQNVFYSLFYLDPAHPERSDPNTCYIPEAEFLDVIETKVLRVFLLAIHSHLYKWTPPPLERETGL
jgi:hypothetical protein